MPDQDETAEPPATAGTPVRGVPAALTTRGLLFCLLVLLVFAFAPHVQAQPAHAPGTICYTPQFWCWAPQAGPPGAPCACPTPYGWVYGTLG